MKKLSFIVLLCLARGLFAFTQTSYNTPQYNYYDSNNTTKIANAQQIIKEIHFSRGLLGSSKKLKKSTEKVNTDNVMLVIEYYKRRYNKSIFSTVMRSVFISSDARADAAKHIKDTLMQAMKREGIYTDDIDKLIDEHINYEKNKTGRMKSKCIKRDLKPLYDRYDIAKSEKNTLYYGYNTSKSKKTIIYPANGKIDSEFNQGKNVQDCWLISAIKSLSINPKGEKMLEDILSVDNNGNVTVQLKGVDKEYTISKEELEGANELAQGDLDVRAIEIAIRRYFYERKVPSLFEKIKNMFSGPRLHPIHDYRSDLYKGIRNISIPYYLLFGTTMVPNSRPDNELINNIKSGKYATVVASFSDYKMNGYIKKHAYAVIGADDNNIYLFNPYNPSAKLTMTHRDFLKFFSSCYSTKLSD